MGSVVGKVSVEQPAYQVLKKTADYEIRQYPPLRVAEVSIADMNSSEKLSGYDFESQADKENKSVKISMTAPVLSVPVELVETRTTGSTMSFVLPREYINEKEPPQPTDARVHLREIPARKMAAFIFRGTVDRDTLEADRAARCKEQLLKDGVKLPSDKWEVARYNPPFTPPLLRRNEILFEIEF
eukprot:jgi/Galph1/2225/GphlegSOOS_G897.1